MKKVGVLMGSDSDLPIVRKALDTLRAFGVPYEVHVYSAHRTPAQAQEFCVSARDQGFGVLICAAGMAAHLAGAAAANTILCGLNLLCLTRGQKVLGHAPQFTAYIDHVNCSGSVYECYYLNRERGYRFEVEGYLERMGPQYDLFIVENPNNPTGQILALEEPGLADKLAARRTADREKVLEKNQAVEQEFNL
mgnify:CR=1 FL=1